MSQLIILMKNKAKSCHMSIHCSLFCIELRVDIFLLLPLICISRVFSCFSLCCSPLDPEHSCCLSMSHWLGNAVLNSLPQRSS